jgi:alpha-galactosidase
MPHTRRQFIGYSGIAAAGLPLFAAMRAAGDHQKPPARFSLSDLLPGLDNHFLSAIATSPLIAAAAQDVSPPQFQQGLIEVSRKVFVAGSSRCLDVTWAHVPTGLEAAVRYAAFADTGVLEVEGRLANRGPRTVRRVRGPFSIYASSGLRGTGTPRVTTVSGGANTDGCYPPPSYRVAESWLTDLSGVSLLGGREGGRSTETVMPYMIVTDPESRHGFFLALEWPCRWIMQMAIGRDDRQQRTLQMWAHPSYTDLDLKPGESIVIPKIELGFFRGDGDAGSSALRRHVVRHVMPPLQGGSRLPPVFYNSFLGVDPDWDENMLKREADAYADLGVEYFVVDAGWFAEGFRKGIGNWQREDRKRFPHGMQEFSRYVESRGMKFGSWLEIEFAMQGSDWGQRHRDWFRDATGQRSSFYGARRSDDLLLRLEDASVRSRVADFLETWVDKYRIRWLRWDFNDAPVPFWSAHEQPDCVGALHLGYGEGLLALLDEFLRRCPQVHVEACAGGGHRMDLGTLRRAHSAWMSDNSLSYHAIRRFQMGVNRVLPGNYANSCFLWSTHPRQRLQSLAALARDGYPPAVLRSRMAGSLGFSEQTFFWTPGIRKQLHDEIAKYKSVRHLLQKNFHPLREPGSLKECDGWQFHDPQTGEGMVMAFRCEADTHAMTVDLPGLEKGVAYELTDMDDEQRKTIRGGAELEVGLREPNAARWLKYRPA